MTLSDQIGYRSSPLQQLVWSRRQIWRHEPYVQIGVRVEGAIDVSRLSDAVCVVVGRHESLRTSLVGGLGRAPLLQVIAEPRDPVLRVLGSDARDLDLWHRQEVEGLDPVAGPTFRVALHETERGKSTLVLTAHALVCDRTSLRVVLDEVAAEYAAPGQRLQEAPLQYADFAEWHHEVLHSEQEAMARAEWADYLSFEVAPAVLEQPGSTSESRQWATCGTFLSSATSRRLKTWAASVDSSPEEVLATVFDVLVWRLSGERDVVVSTVDDGRSHALLFGAVGAFEREVPVVCRFTPATTFLEVLTDQRRHRVRWTERADILSPAWADETTTTEAFFAFEAVVAPGPVACDRATFVPSAATSSALAALRLTCHLEDLVRLEVGHDSCRVAPFLPQHVLTSFASLLDEVLEDPEKAIGELEMLPAPERRRLLAAGTGPRADRAWTPIHEAIAEQARRTPVAVAVVDDAETYEVSYADLDARANGLAHQLITVGVRPGDAVVISVGRSAELLVAMLGVLKAGAAFVPVDVAYPVRRLQFVIDETSASVALVGRETRARLDSCAAVVLVVEEDLAAPRQDAPSVPVGQASLAYVMYTSGTTGVPNGVEITHPGLSNYLSWCAESFRLHEGSGAVVHSSISFDLTLTALLGPLLVGQRVIMIPEDAGTVGLVRALRERRDLSLVKLTPTHLDIVSQLLSPAELDGRVRTLVVGGEALRAEIIEPFREAGTLIVNEYGPTEAVIGSIAYEVTVDTPHTGPVPIGAPIAAMRAYVLAPRGRLAVPGCSGEVYLAGPGVAAGYLKRPELTAEKFVDNPFDGGVMYRTGDLARWRADGLLEYCGRADDQIKIRGVRVEPAEVESVLLQHPHVRQAVVLADNISSRGRSSPLDESVLIAYVVPAAGTTLTSEDVLEHCRAWLPDVLKPAVAVILNALPFNANGKVDRSALPSAASRVAGVAVYVAPKTAVEEILVNVVASVLGVDRVGIDDDYFALGGDSIRSVMVVSRAQARGVNVTVADLHRMPTVRRCAAHLAERSEVGETSRSAPFGLLTEDDRRLIPDQVEDAFPLNLLQEGMIFHRDFASKSAVYHAIASVRLVAPFDEHVMRSVIRQLVERHPMLRTSFDLGTFSRPLQLVHKLFETPFHVEDVRGMPPEVQAARIDGWVEREKDQGFELSEYPLIRFNVHRLDNDSFQFTYGFHHEIVDGWSEALMLSELFSHYFSVIFDEALLIRPPVSTMHDAVALELEALKDPKSYEFWDSYLADATLMRLPRWGKGPEADKGERDIVRIAVPVPVGLSDALKRLAVENAVPLKTVLMSAHMAVMSAYGGHTDTLSYTVTNGRPESADGSTAIGLFVNSLALRIRMGGGSWSDLIRSTLESERASLPFRRLPMAELKRHQGSEPLAEALFFFTNYHVFSVLDRWKDRGVEHVADEMYGESTFPFCGIFRLNRESGDLEVRIEYDSLQFSTELMDGVRDCYRQVMEAMVADPSARYDARAILPRHDEEFLASAVSGDQVSLPETCLHELIEQRAAAHPDAIAVRYGDVDLSYAGLTRRANQLAHLLREHGVSPEVTVGVLGERSVEQILCILAVLKAGGAYVPLDPGQPRDRIDALIQASGVRLLLVQEGLPIGSEVPALFIDGGLRVCAEMPEHPPETQVLPGNAAYVMFTSGSTGQPKGVVVEHRQVQASLAARSVAYDDRDLDRFLLLSSFAFDSSVAGIFWTLTRGATLVLPPEGMQLEPTELARTIARHRPSHLLAIPSLLAPVVAQARQGDLDSLRLVIAAGEACPVTLWESCRVAVPGGRLVNEYGPTEATVWSTVWSDDIPGERQQLPIGRPVSNTRAEVLNPHGHRVPIGVAGEIHLAGAGVARGYLGRPADTARSFRPDPGHSVGRRYATGDIGRYLPDGQLEFLGRLDDQIKVRGFRVEPAEVEAVLDGHPDLQRSIVVARGAATDKALVAYVLPVRGRQPSPAELQQFVRERLPKYMVPAACVVLEEVPLTPTGKVDRRSLPEPTQTDLGAGHVYRAPRTDTEKAIVAIWEDVLKLESVGIDDPFFELGGESLRAMQVTTATNRIFRVEMSVRHLFDSLTIAAYAVEVDIRRAVHEESSIAPPLDSAAAE